MESEDFSLKSSRRESRSLYEITTDNPQKDNFRKVILGIDKKCIFDIDELYS